jgi:hypothetical protein
MANNPIILSYDFLKKCEEFKNNLDKAKKVNPETDTELLAIQIGFATWLSKFIPNPLKIITSNISELGDDTLKDPNFIKYQNDKYNDELVRGIYNILKKHNLTFDSTRDMKIIFDDKYIGTIPKDTLHKFNLVQQFVSSAELVYKEITELDISQKFADIEKHSSDFHKHSVTKNEKIRYKKRIKIEHIFSNLKSNHKLENRYEKYIDNYEGLLYLYFIKRIYKY